jgi:DNA-directed RNA polymerase specialized sigma24 family protein
VSGAQKKDYDKLCEMARAKRVPAQDASDVVGDAFVTLGCRKEPLPESAEQRKALTLTLIGNRALAYRKSQMQRRRRELLVDDPAEEEPAAIHVPDPSRVVIAREQIEYVWPFLRPEHRTVLLACAAGEEVPETARRLGENENTVRSWLQRGRAVAQRELAMLGKRERRGIRGVLVVVGLSGLAAASRVAHGSVARVLELFRGFTRFLEGSLRFLSGIAATVGVLAFLPSGEGLSAKEPVRPEVRASTPAPASPPAAAPISAESVGKCPCSPEVAKPALPAAPKPRKDARPASRSPTSNVLLLKAKAALERGNPRAAIEILDAAARTDPNAGYAPERKILRAAAERALSLR